MRRMLVNIHRGYIKSRETARRMEAYAGEVTGMVSINHSPDIVHSRAYVQ